VTDRATLFDLAKRAMLPAAMLVVIAYFSFHAIVGNTGLLAWREYKAEHAALRVKAQALAAQRVALERQTALLNPRHVNPDFADELVRRNLGVVGRDEAVVDLPPPPGR
jgi:cell division protein FtsB